MSPDPATRGRPPGPGLFGLLTDLEDGEVEKLVLTQRNRVRAVVVSVERWSQLERELAERD